MNRLGLRLLLVLLVVLSTVQYACAVQPILKPILIDNLWGYMNENGEVVISPQWEEAGPFCETAALVTTVNGLDALIDFAGNYILAPIENRSIEEYDYAYLIVDTSDRWCLGFFDKKSGFYLEPANSYIEISLLGEDGNGPIAITKEGGNYLETYTGYVDRTTGEIVIPFSYTGLSDYSYFRDGMALPADEYIVWNAEGDEVEEYHLIYHLIDDKGNEYDLPDDFVPSDEMDLWTFRGK